MFFQLFMSFNTLFYCLLLFLFNNSFSAKNILLIMADDMKNFAGVSGAHPQVKTPNIDKLASKGVTFRKAFCPSPVCLPSRTAMLSGLRPSTTGITHNDAGYFRNLPGRANHITLPQYFMNKGYFTARGGKIFHSDPIQNDDPPSWNQQLSDKGVASPKDSSKITQVGGAVWGVSDQKTEETGEYKSAEFIANFIRKGLSKNFFLAYGAFRPHDPWILPKEFTNLYRPDTLILPTVLENDLGDVPYPAMSRGWHKDIVAAGKFSEAFKAYLESVAFADYCIGRVLTALEQSPYRDSTIVLIMGDHGWHTGEKNHWGKATLWDESTETFLIIYDPSIGVSGVSNHIVNLQDVYATLIDLTNGQKPEWLEGRSLKPILQNPNTSNFIGWSISTLMGHHSMRTNKWAYLSYSFGATPKYELYNMFTDPLQHINLAKDPTPEHLEIMNKLEADKKLIFANKEPVNTNIYGEYLTPVFRINPKNKNPELNALKIYSLKIYNSKGTWVKSFQGSGLDIIQMIHHAKKLGIPKGNYLYRVVDTKNKIILTNQLDLEI